MKLPSIRQKSVPLHPCQLRNLLNYKELFFRTVKDRLKRRFNPVCKVKHLFRILQSE